MLAFLQSTLAFVVVVFTILHVLAVREDDVPILPPPPEPER